MKSFMKERFLCRQSTTCCFSRSHFIPLIVFPTQLNELCPQLFPQSWGFSLWKEAASIPDPTTYENDMGNVGPVLHLASGYISLPQQLLLISVERLCLLHSFMS